MFSNLRIKLLKYCDIYNRIERYGNSIDIHLQVRNTDVPMCFACILVIVYWKKDILNTFICMDTLEL
jgi:hypothetical protein